ncbi:hypothetical protein [Oryza sativa Japonica Group]|uniref:Uncharacterized protein n=1 Tax=Oryza sativa subsp. japonica TaxID=39947 RepID=Q5NAE3_ORYSJ|nr:hypothetical protein [Oryza sativa Japonica Group]
MDVRWIGGARTDYLGRQRVVHWCVARALVANVTTYCVGSGPARHVGVVGKGRTRGTWGTARVIGMLDRRGKRRPTRATTHTVSRARAHAYGGRRI